jgi:hypothetical protein
MRLSLLTNGNMKKQRTLKQNNSIHKYCELLAKELNTLGLDMRVVLKPEIKIMWTPEACKSELFKPVMKAMYGKESTTELTTSEVSKVYEQIAKLIREKFGCEIDFPSKEQLDDYWKDYK